jgi:hypothetical protein
MGIKDGIAAAVEHARHISRTAGLNEAEREVAERLPYLNRADVRAATKHKIENEKAFDAVHERTRQVDQEHQARVREAETAASAAGVSPWEWATDAAAWSAAYDANEAEIDAYHSEQDEAGL